MTRTDQESRNLETVLAFYEKGLNQKDADAALKYVGNRYVQHNPTAPDGAEGFRKFIGYLKDKSPASHGDIKRSFADGDFVVLHVHAVRDPGTRGNAIVDVFKLEDRKIVEHWDVIRPIPRRRPTSMHVLVSELSPSVAISACRAEHIDPAPTAPAFA